MCSKRMFSLLVSGALLFTLTACGPKQAPPASSSEPPDTSVLAPGGARPGARSPLCQPPHRGGLRAGHQPKPAGVHHAQQPEKALPQLGVSQADIIYEALAEGGITRMLGVFQSVEGVGDIGSVRSARDYYVSLALGHDAIFLHAGGSPGAYTAIDNWGVSAFDCVNGPYEGTLFWRDQQRRKNMGLEHSVLTSGRPSRSCSPPTLAAPGAQGRLHLPPDLPGGGPEGPGGQCPECDHHLLYL